MKAWYLALQQRERNALRIAATIVLLFSFWRLIFEPMSEKENKLQARVATQQDDLKWMHRAEQSIASLSRQLPTKRRSRGGQSLLALVDQSARLKGLGAQIRRAEPAGDRRVRVSLEQARFDNLMKWTESLHQNYGLMTVEITLDETAGPGLVNARVTFEDEAKNASGN